MPDEWGHLGKYKRTRQSLMRAADTRASSRFTFGGQAKKKRRPEPSMPKLKCLDDEAIELPTRDRK